jgi:hypothetical protein
MARQFHMNMDGSLFTEVGLCAAQAGMSPAAFVEKCIRQAITQQSYELFTTNSNSKRNALNRR